MRPGSTSGVSPRNEPIARRPRRRYRLIGAGFSMVVLAASLWYISRTFHWHELARVLRDVNLAYLIVGGGASIVVYWILRTLRWHILLRQTGTHVGLLDLYMCTAVSLSFALFTPLQSGEVLKVELLKKYGMMQRPPGYGSFFVERVCDLAVLLTAACVSMLTVVNVLPGRIYAYLILVCVFAALGLGAITLARLRPAGRPGRVLESMRQCLGSARTLVLVIVLTCLSWASVAFSWQIFLYSAGIDLGFARSVALMSIVAVAAILSLIPGGVGVSEASSSQLLIHFGLPSATSQAGALVLRSYSLVAIALGLGHLGLWKVIRARRSRQLVAAAGESDLG